MLNGNMTKHEMKKWQKHRAAIRARRTQHNFSTYNQPKGGGLTSLNSSLKPQAQSAIAAFVSQLIRQVRRPTQQARSAC
jgi:hypothetical protein